MEKITGITFSLQGGQQTFGDVSLDGGLVGQNAGGAAGAVLSLTRTAVNHLLIFGDFTGRAFFAPPQCVH